MNPAPLVVLTAVVLGAASIFWLRGVDLPSQQAPVAVESASTRQPSGRSAREHAGAGVASGPKHVADPPHSSGDSDPPPELLDEQTLVNTTWGRDGFEFELAPGGVVLIGGRERAGWEIIGDRIRLFDQRGEEHWLDMENGRITWNGEEVGRVR